MFELHARWSSTHGKRVKPFMIRGTGRCRKCEACMSYKAWFWGERAKAEYEAATLTLFGTITMSPEQHYMLDARIASGTLDARGKVLRPPRNMRDLTAQELFSARVQAFGDELRVYLDRIRKGRDGQKPVLRYLLVAEAHDGATTSEEMRGRVHFHLMLHTTTPELLVRGRPGEPPNEWYVHRNGKIFVADTGWLRTQWTYGFTKFEVAKDHRAAWYVCKYITKAMACRVRASHKYGQTRNGVEQTNDVREVTGPTRGPRPQVERSPTTGNEGGDAPAGPTRA